MLAETEEAEDVQAAQKAKLEQDSEMSEFNENAPADNVCRLLYCQLSWIDLIQGDLQKFETFCFSTKLITPEYYNMVFVHAGNMIGLFVHAGNMIGYCFYRKSISMRCRYSSQKSYSHSSFCVVNDL